MTDSIDDINSNIAGAHAMMAKLNDDRTKAILGAYQDGLTFDGACVVKYCYNYLYDVRLLKNRTFKISILEIKKNDINQTLITDEYVSENIKRYNSIGAIKKQKIKKYLSFLEDNVGNKSYKVSDVVKDYTYNITLNDDRSEITCVDQLMGKYSCDITNDLVLTSMLLERIIAETVS